ncbi:MAG: amidohydrolase family protein [Candidatus Hodarchaeales archaeon]
MSKVIIENGYVIDPTNGIDCQKMDLFIENGRIVEGFKDGESSSAQRIDATGKLVMPGGFDIHTHIAGANLTAEVRNKERKTFFKSRGRENATQCVCNRPAIRRNGVYFCCTARNVWITGERNSC